MSKNRPSWPKRPAIIVIDSATYLLTISSPDINKVAMSLYDIINGEVNGANCEWMAWDGGSGEGGGGRGVWECRDTKNSGEAVQEEMC